MILLFLGIGVVFVPVGALVILVSNGVVEVVGSDYAAECCIDDCGPSSTPWERIDNNPCNVTITVNAHMEPPIFLYYRLTDYYQNHRRYVRSRDDSQLMGDERSEDALLKASSCRYHVLGAPSGTSNSIINPCGLVAWSVFNDSFAMFNAQGSPIALNESGIAWPSDVRNKFKNSHNGTTGDHFPPFARWKDRTCDELPTETQRQLCHDAPGTPQAGWCYRGSGYCVEDEHFIVWMRAAGLPNFRKLYAKIDTPLEPGTYTVRVSNGEMVNGELVNAAFNGTKQRFLYPVSSFGGTKAIALSTTSWMGGRNFFLGYAYVVVGVICIVLALCFLVKYRMSPRDLGDAAFVTF